MAVEPADNWYIHVALLGTGPGDILVVDVQGYVDAGPRGDVLTLAVQQRGLAGLVLDGAVRDSQQIAEAGFPIFTRGCASARPARSSPAGSTSMGARAPSLDRRPL